MAATSRTETYDAAYTATSEDMKRRKVTDNIFDATPTLDRMRRSGALEIASGGKEFRENLLYGENSMEYFDGYDTLNTNAVDGITAAFFNVRYAACPITISFTEEQENKGAAQVFDLMETKIMQSMQTITTGINAGLYSAQSGKSILGNQDIQASDPSTGTIGGINRATETWWRNKANASGGDFNAKSGDIYTGLSAMGDMYNQVSEGNIEPTNIWTTLTLFGELEEILESTGYARLTGGSGSAGVDASKPKFRNATVNYDRDCGSGLMYFDNYKYKKLKVLSGVNFSKTPFADATAGGQLAKIAYVVVGLNVITNNPRRLGVVAFT